MPAPDFSAANAGGAVVSYVLDIDHYWHIKQLHGQRFVFSPFEAEGCSWRIHYYPNGASPSCHSVCTDISESSEVGARHGCDLFIRKKFLETSGHLYNGDFAIRWDISVDRATPLPYLDRYPWHTNIVFQVRGETFCAHRCVLAARSPKFEAQLFSETMEPGTAGDYCIRIDDMLPEVFDSLLHFVYTDSLPEMTEEEESWMVEHLLVAANRFGVQHLKLVCEEILCDDINEDTIGIMLRAFFLLILILDGH
ncbi:hypothetical protein HU200_049524 [Digitaria exilis]|uniref:BTB domain-containing protein n=1 Tax=Digitaria exilis TaxID=1010633 RepID=A0A835B480_9POAL|nr:hypothetical protein HU200_049524 [Digitaria exilis]